MDEKHRLGYILGQLSKDLRSFIDLSLQESDESWEKWAASVFKAVDVKCWEKKKCDKNDCPKYMNAQGRCWLVVGTMCGGEVQGKFSFKYKSCTECDVYKETVYSDPLSETYEHLITLIHSLRSKEQELKTLAVRDALTGLYNRNYFDIVIARERERIDKFGGILSIIMIDVNKFKLINDMYGHLHGDGILRECAFILGKAIRSSDVLVRFGGDEFIIIMPDTDCSQRDPLIARIDKHLAVWNNTFGSYGYRLSFSVGCALFEQGKDVKDVIKKADDNMYANKLKYYSSDADANPESGRTLPPL